MLQKYTRYDNVINRLKKRYQKIQLSNSPQMNLVWGFFLYTTIGFALLSIPLFHKVQINPFDNLFISTSAVSTTGLVTISIYDSYNIFGQLIILSLFQLGGIGYMTLTTYYLLITIKRISHFRNEIIGAEFTLPDTIRIRDFIRSVVIFTLLMEILGAVAFYIAFTQSGMDSLKAIWFSIFHSVSTFCTAGFSLFNDSFEQYADNNFINIIISCLAIAGSLGFIVITDVWYRISRKTKNISFTTRVIFYGFVLLLSIGTLLFLLSEDTSLLQSFFQTMTAMTTVGFNTIPLSDLSLSILLLVVFLMYIGASPSGTAGGLKITTLTAMFSVLKSRLFGQEKVTFLNKVIPLERLYVATATFILYTSLIFLFTYLLSYTDRFSLEQILFEVASALGTVGLSTGITGELSVVGKILIIILMFIGRVGVLTFGFALLKQDEETDEKATEDDLAV